MPCFFSSQASTSSSLQTVPLSHAGFARQSEQHTERSHTRNVMPRSEGVVTNRALEPSLRMVDSPTANLASLYTAQSCTAEQHQCSLALHSCAMCYQSGTPTCAVSWHCCGTAQSSTRCSVHNGARFPFQTGHAMCIVTNANLRTVPDLLENKAVIRYSMIFYIITTKPSQRVDVLRNSMIKKQFKRLICPCSIKCCRLCACFHHLPLQVLRFCCIMTFDTYFSIEKTPVTLIFNTCAPVVFQHVSNYCQAQAAKPCQNPQRCSHPQVQIVLDTPHCWKGNQCDLKWQDPNHALDPHFFPFPSFVS